MIAVNKINDVIKLAQAKEDIYNKNADTPWIVLNSKLEQYLNGLTFDEVKSLQAIMYLGRDKDYDKDSTPQEIHDSQVEYFDSLGWNTKEIEIDQMIGKVPFADYLINGKTIVGL